MMSQEETLTVLLSIYEKHGELTPPLVVAESRPKGAYLHNRFEWNDGVAGDRYREQQARQIIRVIKVDVPPDNGNETTVHAFVNVVTVEGEQGYVPVDVAFNDVPSWEYVVEETLMLMHSAEKRLKGLFAFAKSKTQKDAGSKVLGKISEVIKEVENGKDLK